VQGNRHCTNNFFCDDSRPCQTNAECQAAFGPNFFCQSTTCGGTCGQVCAPECGTTFPTSTATEGARSNA
jgi:hypothetical protein